MKDQVGKPVLVHSKSRFCGKISYVIGYRCMYPWKYCRDDSQSGKLGNRVLTCRKLRKMSPTKCCCISAGLRVCWRWFSATNSGSERNAISKSAYIDARFDSFQTREEDRTPSRRRKHIRGYCLDSLCSNDAFKSDIPGCW